MSSQPKYDVSKRSKFKLTDEVMEEIDRLVSENEKHRLAGRSKQQLKKIDIYEYLNDNGSMLDIQQYVITLEILMIKKKLMLGKNMI